MVGRNEGQTGGALAEYDCHESRIRYLHMKSHIAVSFRKLWKTQWQFNASSPPGTPRLALLSGIFTSRFQPVRISSTPSLTSSANVSSPASCNHALGVIMTTSVLPPSTSSGPGLHLSPTPLNPATPISQSRSRTSQYLSATTRPTSNPAIPGLCSSQSRTHNLTLANAAQFELPAPSTGYGIGLGIGIGERRCGRGLCGLGCPHMVHSDLAVRVRSCSSAEGMMEG